MFSVGCMDIEAESSDEESPDGVRSDVQASAGEQQMAGSSDGTKGEHGVDFVISTVPTDCPKPTPESAERSRSQHQNDKRRHGTEQSGT